MNYFVYTRKSEEDEDRQVMSLQSQQDEVSKLVDRIGGINIIERFEEAKSAKALGRPVFNKMLDRIEQGEADGIIAWHPDRLARNSMDGGRIVYLLDQGKLKDLKFCTYTFENTSEGKMMLSIIFAQSKYYVDNLSTNVKRGLRNKVKNGVHPNLAPIGYRNCKDTQTVVPDGDHFAAVQRMLRLMLTGQYSIGALHRLVRDEWGYTTPIRKTRGGKPLSKSALHRLLSNPFYAGNLVFKGELYSGTHQPMISQAEFDQLQAVLRKDHQPRPKKRAFLYGGVFKCGVCGLSVTAEHKRNRWGSHYTYYHCTRVHRSPR
ncbi:recombinase family protein, partial [uncultured Tateyamaria sp.]|uniref:recombinase family protein n=1 Tax=uncultured Tateyamaria sp. TaxID=455651 RepID=UPI0026362EF1